MTMLAIGSSRLEAFAQLITLVLIFAFVLALNNIFATKWVGNYQKEKMSGSNITVLETMKISGTKYLQIIKIKEPKCFAIAVCKDTITYLCEVNEEDLIYRENNSSKLKSENFNAILEKFKKRQAAGLRAGLTYNMLHFLKKYKKKILRVSLGLSAFFAICMFMVS